MARNKGPLGNVITSKNVDGKIITLEKSGEYLFVVRQNAQTLSMSRSEEEARKKYDEIQSMPKGGDNMGDGEKKFKEVGEKLKAETAEKEESELATKEVVKGQLAAIRENPELAELYRANAKVGAENIGGSAPYLRIHTANSTANELPDGTYPKDGNFFYAPTKEQFDVITCHILTVSRGFKVWQENKKENTKKLQFNQIVGGVIVDNGELKPFIMYFNGLKLQPLWKFGKEASEFTRQGIPMFAMVVELSTEQVKSDYGMKWVPKFEIVKQEGMPEMILDVETFNVIKNGVASTEQTIKQLIDAKASEDESEPVAGVATAGDSEADYTA